MIRRKAPGTFFDPNKAADPDAGIFGLPCTQEQSALIYLPIPWEATTSYGSGAANGPSAILKASGQIDLFDLEVEKPYEPGLFMLPESRDIYNWNKEARSPNQTKLRMNKLSRKINKYVYDQSLAIMKSRKILGIVGGDHSCPLGAFKAAGEIYGDFGLLHFDAHSDTRDAYEGFQYSHASIMRNALEEVPRIKKLVQIGIRDCCEEEYEYALAKKTRCKIFYDADIQRAKMQGICWSGLTKEIIKTLPQNIWISFDIDGLVQHYCPHTGTPVPGGLELCEATYLIGEVVRSGRKILGFDLCEVAPAFKSRALRLTTTDEWDANVGMRLLYKLSAWTLASQGKVKISKR